MNITPEGPNLQQSDSKQHWWGRYGRLLVVAMIAVVAIVLLNMQREPVEPRPAAPPPIDYSDKVKERVERAAAEDHAALQQFQNSLSAALTNYNTESSTAAATAAGYASTYESIGRIIGYLAYDQIKSTDAAGAYLNALISPPLKKPVDRLVSEVNTATSALEYDLQKISVQLAVDLAALGPKQTPLPTKFTSSQEVKRDFENTLKNLGIDAGIVGVSIAFDVYAIVSTRLIPRLVTTIAEIAVKLFEKQIAKAVIVISGPLADGPLPVGDAIAVLFAAWTAYDIYQLKPEFHESVRTASENQLREIGAEIRGQASDNANRRVDALKSVQSRIGAQSLKQLSN